MLNKKVLRGGFVLIIAFGLFNILNFVYQFFMVRMLSVADYGVLATLLSIISIFAVFSEAIQTVIAKYSVSVKKPGQLNDLVLRSIKKASNIANKIVIFYLIISPILAYYFEISYMLFVLNGAILYIVLLIPVTRGAIQGGEKFLSFGTNLIIEAVIKLVFSFVLVFAGFRVYGALGGVLASIGIAFIASFVPLRKIYGNQRERFEEKGIYSYAKPTLIVTAIIVLFYNMDILIAKLVFGSEDAGAYAIASILGKIILWVSTPIGKAMFPLSAESENKKEKNNGILKTTLIMLILFVCAILLIFYLFSGQIIGLFSGEAISSSADILFYLGIAFSFITLSNILLIYQLSIGRIKKYYVLIICNVLEIVMLWTFSSSLKSFSYAFIAASGLLFIGSIIFVKLNRHI